LVGQRVWRAEAQRPEEDGLSVLKCQRPSPSMATRWVELFTLLT